MTIIYQWEITTFMGNVRFGSRVIEAKETKKHYKALKRNFLNYSITIPKESIGVVVSNGTRPIYSSLDPNEEVALSKLKEWFRKYTDQTIADLVTEIERRESILQRVESLEAENDTEV